MQTAKRVVRPWRQLFMHVCRSHATSMSSPCNPEPFPDALFVVEFLLGARTRCLPLLATLLPRLDSCGPEKRTVMRAPKAPGLRKMVYM